MERLRGLQAVTFSLRTALFLPILIGIGQAVGCAGSVITGEIALTGGRLVHGTAPGPGALVCRRCGGAPSLKSVALAVARRATVFVMPVVGGKLVASIGFAAR